MPIEPPATTWLLPDPAGLGPDDLVGVGADLEPGTLLAGYRAGMFPMPIAGQLAWWSPDPRAILPLDGLRISRSLRKSCLQYRVTIDTAFAEVLSACADPTRHGGWISPDIQHAYRRLHRLGWAHSVEAWTAEGQLAGGLYGVAVGGFFAGESMFHHRRDASKVALVGLVDVLSKGGAALLDVQWPTDHLRSLGAIGISRRRYLELLGEALGAADRWPFAGIPPS